MRHMASSCFNMSPSNNFWTNWTLEQSMDNNQQKPDPQYHSQILLRNARPPSPNSRVAALRFTHFISSHGAALAPGPSLVMPGLSIRGPTARAQCHAVVALTKEATLPATRIGGQTPTTVGSKTPSRHEHPCRNHRSPERRRDQRLLGFVVLFLRSFPVHSTNDRSDTHPAFAQAVP